MVTTGQDTWQALSDPTRRKLLDLLRDGPATTGELCRPFDVSRYAVMKHLAVLERAELIRVHRKGRQRFNELNADPLRTNINPWIRDFEAYWRTQLDRLKHHVESESTSNDSTDHLKEGIGMSKPSATACNCINIELEVKIKGSKDRVFDAITKEIDKWWAYRVCRGGLPMKLEAFPGGRFFEGDDDGNGLVWGRVLQVVRPDILRVEEPMGNMPLPLTGAHIYELTTDGDHTVVKLTCQQMGQLSDKDRDCLESGWRELLETHLRTWIEDGVACEKLVDDDCG